MQTEFDFELRAHRRSDPLTSQLADSKIAKTELRMAFVEAIASMKSATSKEVEDYWRLKGNKQAESIRKRAKECVLAGWVKTNGARKCSVTGNVAIVYEVRK